MFARMLLAAAITAAACYSPIAVRATGVHAPDTVRFQVAIGGTVKDNGTVSANATSVAKSIYDESFTGCAIVKQKAAADVLGAYTFEIHISPDAVSPGAGVKSQGDGLYFSIDHYRPNVANYAIPTISARFSFKGRAYGASVTYSKATIRNGGRDGTYTNHGANRLYPAKLLKPLKGLTFQASWHCSTVYHLNSPL